MNQYREHRLYLYMSEPVRFLGMTMGELFLGLSGLGFLFFNIGSGFFQVMGVGGCWGGIFFLRQFKKQKAGTNIKSFLVWHGIAPKPSLSWPSFDKRRWM